jgi:hypothetical protein
MNHEESTATMSQPWKAWFKPEEHRPENQVKRQFVVDARGCQNTQKSEFLIDTMIKKPVAEPKTAEKVTPQA